MFGEKQRSVHFDKIRSLMDVQAKSVSNVSESWVLNIMERKKIKCPVRSN